MACVVLLQNACISYVPFRPQDPPCDSSVIVTLKDGNVERFDPPVVVDREGETIVFRGADREPLRMRESDIAKLEASKRHAVNLTGDEVILTILGAVAVVVACLLAFAAPHDRSS